MSLQAAKLSKRFGNKWILKDIAFEINQGEIFGIVGDNEVGKTTLLKVIEGSESANGGQLIWNGVDLIKSSAKVRGFCFPGGESKSAWQNIFGSEKLSGSEKQISLLRKSFAERNTIILLDDPFSVLTLKNRDELISEFKKTIAENNLTAILVLNDAETAFSVCDRIGVLFDGDFAQVATPREIYETPQNCAAARSIGRNNFITARRVSFTNDATMEFHTLIGEHRLRTDKLEVKRLGAITQNVTLAIRPEHISLSFGASFPEDNLLKAQIEEIQYSGATTRVKLNANGLILESLVLRLVGLNVGDECMVGLPPDRIVVLKE